MNRIGVWGISISGYGSFQYVGTEVEAQEMLSHKANWEGGAGMKSWLRDASELELVVWNESGGPFVAGDSPSEPLSKQRRAKKKRASKV